MDFRWDESSECAYQKNAGESVADSHPGECLLRRLDAFTDISCRVHSLHGYMISVSRFTGC